MSAPDGQLVETVAKLAWGAFMEDSTTETEWSDADPEVKSIWRAVALRIVQAVRAA